MVIETAEEQEALMLGLDGGGDDFTIGLFRGAADWVWVTGESVTELGYDNLETHTVDTRKRCVLFDRSLGGEWRAASCASVDDVLCELEGKRPTIVPPSS